MGRLVVFPLAEVRLERCSEEEFCVGPGKFDRFDWCQRGLTDNLLHPRPENPLKAV